MLTTPSRRALVAGMSGVLVIATLGRLHSADSAVPLAAKDWSTVSGDLGNTRYSTLTQITKETVNRLSGAWVSPGFDAVGAGRAMPVVKDGQLFITAGSSIYALNAKTGTLTWK